MNESIQNEPRGVINNEADRAVMLDRRHKAGDVLAFSPSAPRGLGEYADRGPFSNNISLPGSMNGARRSL
jgi:hypothetical protein